MAATPQQPQRSAGRLQMAGSGMCRRFMHVEYDTFDGWFRRRWSSQNSNSKCCELELGAKNVVVTFSVWGGRTVRKVERRQAGNPWATCGSREEIFISSGDNLDGFFYLQGTSLHSWCSGAYNFGRLAGERPESWEFWDHGDAAWRVDRLGFQFEPVRWGQAAGRVQMVSDHKCKITMQVKYDVEYGGLVFHREWSDTITKPKGLCCPLELGARNLTVLFKAGDGRGRASKRPGLRGEASFDFGRGDGVDAFFSFHGKRFSACDFGKCGCEPAWEWECWDHKDATMRPDQLGFKFPPRRWAGFLAEAKFWDESTCPGER
eukprot:TRINITY_DN43736_c0_g1_i1.p1 TRINITY_DN43736_c0_g1~~TRINITY_DN43736_c0_g1_i1.p1  ORF type:complete len:319 (+),score=34.28 TRINITY_DN43736_c0_g1_i1:238-1194(+)